MLRIGESFGQLRTQNDINQFSTEAAFMKAGLRPDLSPSDLIPMGIQTSWVNPGEAVLRREGEITELTPLGPEATNVFPGTFPAPANTQDTGFEDRVPRIEYRGDQVLRSRSGIRGPAQYWKYGGMTGLGNPGFVVGRRLPWEGGEDENVFGGVDGDDPITFYADPSEVAYQTYPGPMLGQEASKCTPKQMAVTSALLAAAGAAVAFMGAPKAKDVYLRQALTILGVIMGGFGAVGLISSIGQEAGNLIK